MWYRNDLFIGIWKFLLLCFKIIMEKVARYGVLCHSVTLNKKLPQFIKIRISNVSKFLFLRYFSKHERTHNAKLHSQFNTIIYILQHFYKMSFLYQD